MRAILVTGSREWGDVDAIRRVLDHAGTWYGEPPFPLYGPPTLIHGACDGADMIADAYAREYKWQVIPMPAQWKRDGKPAGPLRNTAMLEVLRQLHKCGWDCEVHAFPTANSRGTWQCANLARQYGFRVEVHSA